MLPSHYRCCELDFSPTFPLTKTAYKILLCELLTDLLLLTFYNFSVHRRKYLHFRLGSKDRPVCRVYV